MDGESVILGVAGMAGATLLKKVVGDGYDYFKGVAINKVREVNLLGILTKAEDKIEDINDGKSVPPKILAKIINEGSWADDELNQEYYAGILASSRTDEGTDDSGVYYLNLMDKLSVYHIKLHYLFYKSLKEVNSIYNIINKDEHYKLIHPISKKEKTDKKNIDTIKINIDIIKEKLGLETMDSLEFEVNLNKILTTAYKEELINFKYDFFGGKKNLMLSVTPLGLDFFLWINGFRYLERNDFYNDEVLIKDIGVFKTDVNITDVVEEIKPKARMFYGSQMVRSSSDRNKEDIRLGELQKKINQTLALKPKT